MTIFSWNVNGLRAAVKKGLYEFAGRHCPDILAVQEIKMSQKAIESENIKISGYKAFWNPAVRPGYSGTAAFIKEEAAKKILDCGNGFGLEKFDSEGRLQWFEFKNFYLINAYFPNANHELSRLGFKEEFNREFLKLVKKFEKKKPVIACGDFNVAHQEIDLARPRENVGNPGFTFEERKWMDKFLQSGLVDVFRYLHKDKVQYTWWSYRFSARAKNIGWRIDYFLVSRKLVKKIKSAYILDNVFGSDHCPVGIEIA